MKSLLLFIDFQNVFSEERGGYWPIEDYQKTLDTALQVKNKLLSGDKNNVTIITTRFLPPDPIKGQGWIDYYKDIPKEMHNKEYPGYKLSNGVPKDIIISASTFGKWNAIQNHFNNIIDEFDKVYITGVSTDCCVLTTALAAVDSGIKVFIVENACSAENKEDHNRAINVMKGYGPNLNVISF
jgi:nicotinamidase-related amidase